MNNIDDIKEFRRFVNAYIYPETINILIAKIVNDCNTEEISYDALPQAVIKFKDNITTDNEQYKYVIYNILISLFIEYYNDKTISDLFKLKVHTEVQDEELKTNLRNTLKEIQYGNLQYISLLFNLTFLHEHNSCLYL